MFSYSSVIFSFTVLKALAGFLTWNHGAQVQSLFIKSGNYRSAPLLYTDLSLQQLGDSLPRWTLADTAFAPLPASVKVFRSEGNLDGAPHLAYYVEADLRDKSLNFTTQAGYGKRYTPTQYFDQNNAPLIVVNGTFFSFADNRNLNLVIRNGEIIAHNPPSVAGSGKDTLKYFYPFRSAIGINRKRAADVAWVFTDTGRSVPLAIQSHPVRFWGTTPDPGVAELKTVVARANTTLRKWRKIETAIGGGPVLVQEGKVHITNEEELMFDGKAIHDKHPRTAMGYTRDGKLIILVVQGRFPGKAEGATLEQEARILQQLGCVEALNLDGGGSSCLLVNGKNTIQPSDKGGQRPVPAVFIVSGKRQTADGR